MSRVAFAPSVSPAARSLIGMVLLFAVMSPPIRRATEASMTAHMLVQYIGLLLAGGLLCHGIPQRWQGGLRRWNELGIAGLVASIVILTVLMIPRVLDLALVDARVEAFKVVALVLAGAALRMSWQRAGLVIQIFFLGNMLPMMAVVGTLYQQSHTRLCNAYLLSDQQDLGMALVFLAAGVALFRLGQFARRGR